MAHKEWKNKATEKELDSLINEFLKDVDCKEEKKNLETNEIDKVAFLLIRNKKLLGTYSKGVNTIYIPGGKRKIGETDQETLAREVKEEISAEVIPDGVRYYGTFKAQAHNKPEGVMVKMTCYTIEVSGELKPESEIEKILWITSEDIGNVSPVGRFILTDLKSKNLID